MSWFHVEPLIGAGLGFAQGYLFLAMVDTAPWLARMAVLRWQGRPFWFSARLAAVAALALFASANYAIIWKLRDIMPLPNLFARAWLLAWGLGLLASIMLPTIERTIRLKGKRGKRHRAETDRDADGDY